MPEGVEKKRKEKSEMRCRGLAAVWRDRKRRQVSRRWSYAYLPTCLPIGAAHPDTLTYNTPQMNAMVCIVRYRTIPPPAGK